VILDPSCDFTYRLENTCASFGALSGPLLPGEANNLSMQIETVVGGFPCYPKGVYDDCSAIVDSAGDSFSFSCDVPGLIIALTGPAMRIGG